MRVDPELQGLNDVLLEEGDIMQDQADSIMASDAASGVLQPYLYDMRPVSLMGTDLDPSAAAGSMTLW